MAGTRGLRGYPGAAELIEALRQMRAPIGLVTGAPRKEVDAVLSALGLGGAFEVIKLDGRKWVTVLGDGRLGLLVAQVLREAGSPVRVIGKHPDKLNLCEKWQIRHRLLAALEDRLWRQGRLDDGSHVEASP